MGEPRSKAVYSCLEYMCIRSKKRNLGLKIRTGLKSELRFNVPEFLKARAFCSHCPPVFGRSCIMQTLFAFSYKKQRATIQLYSAFVSV